MNAIGKSRLAGKLAFVLLLTCASCAFAQDFHWNWRNWQELYAKQSLRHSTLSELDRGAVALAISRQIGLIGNGYRATPGDSTDPLDTRVKLIDLNRDGTPEVLAQAMMGCSATGNCPFWIFQKAGDDYKLLLEGYGQTFTIQPNRTNVYNDIVVAMHGNTFDSDLAEFTYADGGYHETGCYVASWTAIENETVHMLKEPNITPCGERKPADTNYSASY